MIGLIGQWGHVLAALTFSILVFWQLRRALKKHNGFPLILAATLTMVWALTFAIFGPDAAPGWTTETIRDIGWITYMHGLWQSGAGHKGRVTSIHLLYGVTLFILIGRIGIDLLPLRLAGSPRLLDAVFYASVLLRMISAVGALMLVHNLYNAATAKARHAIRLPMIALTVMWGYDLNLYTITYLTHRVSEDLVALRGPIMALLAPLFVLGNLRAETVPFKLSRTATFQSLSLVGVGAYLIVMVGGSEVLQLFGPAYVHAFQVSFVFLTALVAILLLPNSRARAWVRVMLSKHLFQHRYDYRAEWLRFTDTLGRQDESAATLVERVIKAIADITESGGGVLLVPDSSGGLSLRTRWNWPEIDVPQRAAEATANAYFRETVRIVELDKLRQDATDDAALEAEARAVPQWMIADPRAWIVVPLIHFERLEGLVLLARPLLDRTLDWEDLDLLRVAGRQVASYLAEAKGQEALSDAQRFDEFNRRFAFIMHDIKNLVSQLSLVTRNAERHIGNPAFQRDMLATLDNSTKRMNDLLARLSQHHKGKAEGPHTIILGALVDAVVTPMRAHHPILITGNMAMTGCADPTRLEQALGHLVQNAIDASGPSDPVTVALELAEKERRISIIDTGCGMTPEFIREQLFKPFVSTKVGGFGIGAYEAREIIRAMGGRLDASSRMNKGSCFTITLPAYEEIANEDIAA